MFEMAKIASHSLFIIFVGGNQIFSGALRQKRRKLDFLCPLLGFKVFPLFICVPWKFKLG